MRTTILAALIAVGLVAIGCGDDPVDTPVFGEIEVVTVTTGDVIDGDGDTDLGDDGLSGTAKFGFVGINLDGGGSTQLFYRGGLATAPGSRYGLPGVQFERMVPAIGVVR